MLLGVLVRTGVFGGEEEGGGVLMMMPFNCSYRNKNEPSAIYPSYGYSPPPERK
jgi:hypothetical protein